MSQRWTDLSRTGAVERFLLAVPDSYTISAENLFPTPFGLPIIGVTAFAGTWFRTGDLGKAAARNVGVYGGRGRFGGPTYRWPKTGPFAGSVQGCGDNRAQMRHRKVVRAEPVDGAAAAGEALGRRQILLIEAPIQRLASRLSPGQREGSLNGQARNASVARTTHAASPTGRRAAWRALAEAHGLQRPEAHRSPVRHRTPPQYRIRQMLSYRCRGEPRRRGE
jgi:hypothetical protein